MEVKVASLGRSSRFGAALVAATLALVAAPAAHAANTYVVNDNGDASDSNTLDTTCATAGLVCTLRAAIEQATLSSILGVLKGSSRITSLHS